MRRHLNKLPLIGAAILLACSFIHPFGPVKGEFPRDTLFSGGVVEPQAARLFEKSCQNCHSLKTAWPWYSYIAPVSWMIESDVHRARSRMNLSRWDRYPIEGRVDRLSRIAVMVRNRAMPPSRYLVLHPAARLSGAEIASIYDWARTERKRLKVTNSPVTSSKAKH